jgi:high affinity sulfate transporter 1
VRVTERTDGEARVDGTSVRALRGVPMASWLPRYSRASLPGDLLAGAVVTALAVPQALGYAGIAGVPVQVGLYAIPLALLAYAVLGSSPHLVVGPVSTVSVLSGSLVVGLAHGDPGRAVALTSALAIAAGLTLLVAGATRIGWAAEFLSKPIVTGFVFGLVILIVVGELPSLLGMPPESGDVLARAWSVLTHLGDLTPLTAAVGAASLAVLFLGARWAPRVPWGLVVLVVGIAVSSWVDLAARGVATVGEVPRGLPPIGVPAISTADLAPVALGGMAIALVALAEGLSAARLFAARRGYTVDADQELLATGAANVAAGLSGGLGVGGSLSKTAAAYRAGSRSQITGLTAATLVLLVLALVAPLLSTLPRTVLSAVVIQAVWGLMDVDALRRYASIRRNDLISALAALGGVVVLGPLYGLLAAVAQAVLGLVYRSSRVDVDVMGKVPGEKAAWGSVARHPERRTTEGVLVLRLDVPLFWANATEVQERVLTAADAHPGTRVVLLDLEATSQLDTTSIDALDLLLVRLRDRGIELFLVRVFHRARRTLDAAGFLERLGDEHMWHSISAAVRAAKDQYGVGRPPSPDGYAVPDPDAVDDDVVAEERIAVEHHHGEDELADELAEHPGDLPVPGAAERRDKHARKAAKKAAKKATKHPDEDDDRP